MALRRCNLDCRLHATHGRCRCAAAPGNPLGHCGTLHLQTIAGTVRHTIVGICAGLILIRITPPCRTASQSRSSIAAAPSLTFTPVAGHGGPANAALLPGWSRPAAVRARPWHRLCALLCSSITPSGRIAQYSSRSRPGDHQSPSYESATKP